LPSLILIFTSLILTLPSITVFFMKYLIANTKNIEKTKKWYDFCRNKAQLDFMILTFMRKIKKIVYEADF
jgi:hypothetical protein